MGWGVEGLMLVIVGNCAFKWPNKTQWTLHTDILLSDYFTVWSNRSDVQHMLIVHLGQIHKPPGGSLQQQSRHDRPPARPPVNSGLSSGCTPEFEKGTLVGYVRISLCSHELSDRRLHGRVWLKRAVLHHWQAVQFPNHTPRRHATGLLQHPGAAVQCPYTAAPNLTCLYVHINPYHAPFPLHRGKHRLWVYLSHSIGGKKADDFRSFDL